MSIFLNVKVPCQNCGSIENYGFYATWFSINGSHSPIIENKCSKCNVKLKVDNPYDYIEHRTVNVKHFFHYILSTSAKDDTKNRCNNYKSNKYKGRLKNE